MEELLKVTNISIVVMAYGECPYLEEALKSIKNQTVPCRTLMVTSTPSDYISNIAKKHGLSLHINRRKPEISDFEFAYNVADTAYVLLAHQDDVYDKRYVERMLALVQVYPSNLIAFSDYRELRGSRIVTWNTVLLVKRLILGTIYAFKPCLAGKYFKKKLLAFGNPVCFPTVLYHKELIDAMNFSLRTSIGLDWEVLFNLAKIEGSFLYCKERLLLRRIHSGSTTTNLSRTKALREKNIEMFRKFWPDWVVRIIMVFYKYAESSNKVVE